MIIKKILYKKKSIIKKMPYKKKFYKKSRIKKSIIKNSVIKKITDPPPGRYGADPHQGAGPDGRPAVAVSRPHACGRRGGAAV